MKTLKSILNLINKLTTCHICHGSGLINADTDPIPCPKCKGKGFI